MKNKKIIKDTMPDFEELLFVLKARFEKNISRHKGIKWESVLARIEKNPRKDKFAKPYGKYRRRA